MFATHLVDHITNQLLESDSALDVVEWEQVPEVIQLLDEYEVVLEQVFEEVGGLVKDLLMGLVGLVHQVEDVVVPDEGLQFLLSLLGEGTHGLDQVVEVTQTD